MAYNGSDNVNENRFIVKVEQQLHWTKHVQILHALYDIEQ